MNLENEKLKRARLTEAHDHFAEMLGKSAYYKVHDKGLSEDLVQEAFLKTWKYIIGGGEVIDMRAFLYHVLHNLIIDEYRKQQHHTSSLEVLTENGFDIGTNDHKRLGESIDRKTVSGYIEELPLKYREVVYMSVVLSMSLEEISDTLNRTKNSVTVQLHRGIKRIQTSYSEKIKGING